MNKHQKYLIFIFLIFNITNTSTFAAITLMEDQTLIGNGNGVSTPSFWQGLNGQNPAGLAFNTTLKVQGSSARFKDQNDKHKESIGILAGNGLIGMGGEWTKFNTLPVAGDGSIANWGAAGRLPLLKTVIGFSGHYAIPRGLGTYDMGAMFDFGYDLRMGIMTPDFARGVRVVALGFDYVVDHYFDFIVDAAYRIQNQASIVKPGLNIHLGPLQTAIAYGLKVKGTEDTLITPKVTAGIGLKITSFLMTEYEYQGLTQHRLGLTLRWN